MSKIQYLLYEQTIDEESDSVMERQHGISARTYAEAAKLLAAYPRYEGIDCFDGAEWHWDVSGPVYRSAQTPQNS